MTNPSTYAKGNGEANVANANQAEHGRGGCWGGEESPDPTWLRARTSR